MAPEPTDESVIVSAGIRVPISDEIVLDWYYFTDPSIRVQNPKLLAYAERLIEEREA